jgi:hypothetical protein
MQAQTALLELSPGEQIVALRKGEIDRWITQLCRPAGFRRKFVQEAASLSQMFTLIGSEGAVTLLPAYLKSFPVAGVAMVQLSGIRATLGFSGRLATWPHSEIAARPA